MMDVSSERLRSPLLMTRVASFTAIGVVSGLGLAVIPNVELVTAVCFISGFLLGAVGGILTGTLTEFIFAGFHPMGGSMGLMLAAQVIGMAFAGWMGAVSAKLSGTIPSRRYVVSVLLSAIVVTLFFDLVTNLAYPVSAGFSVSETWVVLIAGIPFAAIHLASNFFVFLLLVTPLLPRIRKTLKWS